MSDEAPQRSSSNWPFAIAVITVSLVALAAFVFKSCLDQPNRVVTSLAGATQPQVSINTLVQTSLQRLRDESKLVVYTADVAVMVTKHSEKKILYGKLDLGTTTVRLRSSGNKAQLFVPLDQLAEGDIQFERDRNKLIVTLPAPRVDEELVEVQTDPRFLEIQTDVGWARLDTFSGEFLREQARRDLRPAVIAEASDPRILDLAKQSAREKVGALLEAVIKPLDPQTEVVVQFRANEPAL